MGLTATDYVTRSVDALFVPLLVIVLTGLSFIWVGRLPYWRFVRSSRNALTVVVWVLAALGGLLLGIGLWGVFDRTVFEFNLVVSPLSLAIGALLLVSASRMRRTALPGSSRSRGLWLGITELAGTSLLVAICLFWAVSDYAGAVGSGTAQRVELELPGYPGVVLYSSQRLGLTMPGVREMVCGDADGSYPFRYDGLKLILESGGRYFFLPSSWSYADGVALVIPSSESLRLEFTATPRPNGSC